MWLKSIIIFLIVLLSVSCNTKQVEVEEKENQNDTTRASYAINLYMQGEFQESIDSLDQIIKKSPHIADLYFWKAKSLAELGQIEAALKQYSFAITNDSGIAKYYNNRGLLYLKSEDYNSAQGDLERSLSLGTNAIALNNMATYFSRLGVFDSSIYYLNQSLFIDSTQYLTFYNRAIEYLNKADYNRAREDFDAAINLNPNYSEAWLYRGVCFYKMAEYKSACLNFNRADMLGSSAAKSYLEHCSD